MKKILTLTSLLMVSLTLSACNPRNDVNEDKMPQDNSPTESNIPPRTDNELDDGIIDDTTDIEGNLEEDIKDVGEDTEENRDEPVDSTLMTDEEMIENSDYIAKVKMIKKGSSTFELKVLENLKGNLSDKEIPETNKLQENRAYLVFLRDVDGQIEKTNGEESYVLLEGDNHVLFEKINKNR